jgi:hypothetical protein
MQLVDDYIVGLDNVKKEWIKPLVKLMREVFPEIEETFDNKMPTYKVMGTL